MPANNPFGYGPAQWNGGRPPARAAGGVASLGGVPQPSPTLKPSDVIDAMARQPLPYVPYSELAAQQRAYDELLRLQQRYKPKNSATILFGYGQNA